MDGRLDLDLNSLGLRTKGRAAKPLTYVVGRELDDEDLAQLASEGRAQAVPALTKLRERHHTLAKMLAQGSPEQDAAVACGYSLSRVSILKTDQSFRDLVAFYRQGVVERYYDMHEAAAALGRDAIEELHERLEEAPEDFSIPQLMTLTSTMMDRVGHGPSSSTNVNVNIGLADKLEAARRRIASMRDVTPPEAA